MHLLVNPAVYQKRKRSYGCVVYTILTLSRSQSTAVFRGGSFAVDTAVLCFCHSSPGKEENGHTIYIRVPQTPGLLRNVIRLYCFCIRTLAVLLIIRI